MLKCLRCLQEVQQWETASSVTMRARDMSSCCRVSHTADLPPGVWHRSSAWNLTGQGRSSSLRAPPNIQYTPRSVTSLPPNLRVWRAWQVWPTCQRIVSSAAQPISRTVSRGEIWTIWRTLSFSLQCTAVAGDWGSPYLTVTTFLLR